MAAQYPTAAGTDANLFVAANNKSTTLSDNPLTSGATTVNVASTTGFPTAGYITIDAEAIAYTGVTGTSFTTCTRGADGTTAASHTVSTNVFHDVVAAHHNALKDEIKAIETDLVASYTGGSTTIATTFGKYLKLIGGTLTGLLDTTGLRATSNNTAASGAGMELIYSSGGFVQAFDRTGASFQPMTISGSSISLTSGSGATYLSATTAGASLLGTNTNNNASAGNVGQYIESVIVATNIPATGVYGDLTSLSLTAGDWDVSFISVASRNTATVAQFTDVRIGISQTTGNSSTGLTFGSNFIEFSEGTTGIDNLPMQIANYRQSLSGTTTIYAKMQGTYSAGQPQMAGRLSARRIR